MGLKRDSRWGRPDIARGVSQRVAERMSRTIRIEVGNRPDWRIGARGEGPRSVSHVIKEQSVPAPQRSFPVAKNIPGKSDPGAPSLRSIIRYIRILPAPDGHHPAGNLRSKIATRTRREERKWGV